MLNGVYELYLYAQSTMLAVLLSVLCTLHSTHLSISYMTASRCSLRNCGA